eukprot:TRINITY_DN3983_c0_g1_i1.p1 TRINITY_DN3983_c0_g1~~TRINITY_DN3983_c0_g1_i1.p1  ORF type:complete len:984 (-),score=203.37 TRINITY_DN3983_c0_g1_i1:107-3019(-)
MSVQVLNSDHLPLILDLLPKLTDHSPAVQKPAEEQISNLFKVPGFCSLLLEIAANRSNSDNLRIISLILVKNTIEKQWLVRVGTSGAIHPNEKAHIRNLVFSFMDERSDKIFIQLALIVGKIARCDFPNEWPDLITKLFQIVQGENILARLRGLSCINQVQIALRSRRLLSGKRQFREITPVIFNFVINLWQDGTQQILYALSEFSKNSIPESQLESVVTTAESVKLSLKIIHGLLLQGFTDWTQENNVLPFLRKMLEIWKNLIACRLNVPENRLTRYTLFFEKQYGKILIDTQNENPVQWVPLLPEFLLFTYEQMKSTNNYIKHEKFVVNCMMFIRQILTCTRYHEIAQTMELVKSFMRDDIVTEMVNLMLRHYMLLTTDDLNEWQNEPEQFANEEVSELWTEKQRYMSEKLFETLLMYQPNIVLPVVQQLMQETSQPQNMQQILLKDSVYNAIAIGATDMWEKIDFSDWFSKTLIVELQSQEPIYKIIQKRIMEVIGQWVTTITPQILSQIYNVTVSMIGSRDLVMALTAAQTLSYLLKDMSFDNDVFHPYLDHSISHLFRIISSTDSNESILKVLDHLGMLIEEVKSRIRPYTTKFLELTSNLWKKSEEVLIRTAVVRLLEKLVKASGDSYEYQNMLISVIMYCVNIDDPISSLYITDGLSLWLAVVHEASSITEGLLTLYPYLLKILSKTYDHIIVSMKIVESYILLGGNLFVEKYLSDTLQMLYKILSDIRDKGMIVSIKPIETLLLLYPQQIPPLITDILQTLLQLLFAPSEPVRIKVNIIGVFSRLLLQNSNEFFSFFQKMTALNTTGNNLFLTYLPTVLELIDNMAEPSRRKASVLSLLILLGIPEVINDAVLGQHIPTIVDAAVSVIYDEEGGTAPDLDVQPDISDEDDDELYVTPTRMTPTKNSQEWRQLYNKDPVNFVPTRTFLLEKLNTLKSINAGLFVQLVQTVPSLTQIIGNQSSS